MFKYHISGSTANLPHFQAYLVEGIVRWNEDRANEAADKRRLYKSYSYQLRKGVNDLHQKVFGDLHDKTLRPPRPYTGEFQ